MEFIVFLIISVAVLFFLSRRSGNDLYEAPRTPEKVSPWGTRHSRPQHQPIKRPAPPSPKPVIAGPAYVTDGDGLRIKKTEIRLFGVDAPEFTHPYGKKAKWALLALCKGQHVRAEVIGTDDHGRTVAKCFLPDGRDLSAEMVKQGLALDWAKFSGGIYRRHEPSDARKKLWLADARQKGRMHVWEKFEARQKARSAGS